MGRGRAPCCDKAGLKKGPWTPAEDLRLITFIQKHGHGNWRALPRLAGLLRCGKSCRLRWTNYLRPDIKRGNFTQEEEETIIKLHEMLGNKWSKIASNLPGRTDNEIKNVWNTHLKKRLLLKGQNPSGNEHNKEVSATTSSSSSSSSVSYCNPNDHNLFVSESPTEALEKKHASLGAAEEIALERKEKHESKELLRSLSLSSCSSSQIDEFRMEEQTSAAADSGEVYEVQDSILSQDVVKQDIPDEQIIEIPYDLNLDIWDMLEDDDICFSTSSAVPMFENEVDHQHSNMVEKNLEEKDLESLSWVRNLENELGLLQATTCDAVEPLLSTPTSEEIVTYFQMWPSSPLNFNL